MRHRTRRPTNFHSDQDWIVRASASDPLTPWINDAGQFPGLCTAKQSGGRPVPPPIQFPADLVTDCTGNNNAAAVLKADNKTLMQFQPLYRPTAGGPIIAWWHAGAPQDFPWEIDIRSGDAPVLQSALGSHGGSGLSGIGGTIRLGELLPDAPPIAHALKLELWSTPYLFGGVPALQVLLVAICCLANSLLLVNSLWLADCNNRASATSVRPGALHTTRPQRSVSPREVITSTCGLQLDRILAPVNLAQPAGSTKVST